MTANRYLDRLVADGVLKASGETKARTYTLHDFVDEVISFDVTPTTEEHLVWREKIAPLLTNVPPNVLSILEYSVSEMINNVIDHSESDKCIVSVQQNAAYIDIFIQDFGVGIFNKIASALNLTDKREAILELSKGKLTTDPTKHTGEGIFFTSRAMNEFGILSGDLSYLHNKEDGDDDWLIENVKDNKGTWVRLRLNLREKQTLAEIFAKYASDDEGVQIFSRTHVPIRLARYPNEQLVSRSQARRVLSRFTRILRGAIGFQGRPHNRAGIRG